MDRRALLAALAGVTTLGAGCLDRSGSGSGTEDPSTTSTTTPTTTVDPAAEYRITDLSVSTTTDGPDVKYVLDPNAFYSADGVERKREESADPVVVTDVGDIEDARSRELVTTAIRDGEWRGDEVPDGFPELVAETDFFTGVSTDETYTHVGLTLYTFDPDAPPAMEFDATVSDANVSPDSPGTLDLSLTNVSDETQQIFSGTVPPFGTVFAEGDAGRFLLWRPYTEEGCVFFSEEGIGACSIGITTDIEPGETISRRYDVLPSSTTQQPDYTVPPGPGRYRIEEGIGYTSQRGAPGTTLSAEVEFTLEKR